VQERIDRRIDALDDGLGPAGRAERIALIEAEEHDKGTRRAVAGYDLTFSVPKSLSVLWGVADAGTQALIADAHHTAVAQVIAFFEREVATTRVGAAGRRDRSPTWMSPAWWRPRSTTTTPGRATPSCTRTSW
jgi:hypothetical protein